MIHTSTQLTESTTCMITAFDITSGHTRTIISPDLDSAIRDAEWDMDRIDDYCKHELGWKRKRMATRYRITQGDQLLALVGMNERGRRYRVTEGLALQREANGEVVTWQQ